MKWAKIGGAVLAFLVVALVAGKLWLSSYLNSPEFRARVETTAQEQLGCPVHLKQVAVSLGGELRLVGIAVPMSAEENAAPFCSAEELGLSLDLGALLKKKVVITAAVLRSPKFLLAENAQGNIALPFKKVSSQSKGEQEVTAPKKKKSEKGDEGGADDLRKAPVAWALKDVRITEGEVQFLDQKGELLFGAEGIEIKGDLSGVGAASLSSHGNVTIKTVRLPGNLSFTQFSSPVTLADGVLDVNDISARFFEGKLKAQFTANIQGDSAFSTELKLSDVDVPTLIKATGGDSSKLSGTAFAEFKGGGNLNSASDLTGVGELSLRPARLKGQPILNALSSLLDVPGLSDITFDEIQSDCEIGKRRLKIKQLHTSPPDGHAVLKLSGTVGFDKKLNIEGTVALSAGVAKNMSGLLQELKVNGETGQLEVPFKVQGSTDDPKVSLNLEKMGVESAVGVVKGVLDKLFK